MSPWRCDAQTIDFDVTARRIAELTDLARVREQLVLVWNARGAVDDKGQVYIQIKAVEGVLRVGFARFCTNKKSKLRTCFQSEPGSNHILSKQRHVNIAQLDITRSVIGPLPGIHKLRLESKLF